MQAGTNAHSTGSLRKQRRYNDSYRVTEWVIIPALQRENWGMPQFRKLHMMMRINSFGHLGVECISVKCHYRAIVIQQGDLIYGLNLNSNNHFGNTSRLPDRVNFSFIFRPFMVWDLNTFLWMLMNYDTWIHIIHSEFLKYLSTAVKY